MSAPRRVLFYVQHLLGIGHLRRASLVVKAMSAAYTSVDYNRWRRECAGHIAALQRPEL